MAREIEMQEIVFECATVLNEQRAPEKKILLATETILVGDGGSLDSLGLVSLLVMVEEAIEEKFDVDCALVDTVFNENAEDRIWTIADLVKNISEKV